MNSNISNIFGNYFDTTKSNDSPNDINYNNKEEDHKEKNEFKNLRIEATLSLRKKKLNEILFLKRKKEITNNQNMNDYLDDLDVYADINKIENNVPKLLVEEFDIYDEKLSLIHQLLNNDFTILHGMQFDEKYLKQFVIYKLTKLSYEEDNNIYDKCFENELKLIFNDIIKIINESNEKKIIFGITTILINFIFSSEILAQEFKKVNIWKRLAEISELKIPDINDNLVTIMLNLYSNDPNVGKEYILSNYSRYVKQILINFFKTFINESSKENIELSLYFTGISLIKRLIKNENKNKTDLDIIVKMKYLYDYLTKVFVIAVSWILNNVKNPSHESIFKLILYLLELFALISTYLDEETYQMQEFRGESFSSSFCSLLKYLILNKEKNVPGEFILEILTELYNFIGIFFSIESDKTEIYSKNKIIIITEEFIQNINLMKKDLANKILFFLSNYADNEQRVKEIFEDSNILPIIKDYSFNNINDNKICYNIYCIVENGFKMGDNNCKELIIRNFSNFIIERIKIISELIIKNGENDLKHINFIIGKCNLLLYFILFLRNNSFTKLQLLKDLLDYVKISNVEQFIENIQIFIKNENEIQIIHSLLEQLKK